MVRLVAEPEISAWLESRPAMEWDGGNSTKSQTKHGFYIADVESMFEAPLLFAGRIVEPAHEEARYLLWVSRRAGGTPRWPLLAAATSSGRSAVGRWRKKEKEAYDAAT